MSKNVFERVEKKYMLTRPVYEQLLERMEPYIKMDEYGWSTICNIYYDTEHYDLIRTSIDKPKYKEKLRLRSYGVPQDESRVFLEIKKKWEGVVYKRRICITLKQAMDFLEHGDDSAITGQIGEEIKYFVRFYRPAPKLFLAYDRCAFVSRQEPEVRITFDHNIRSRESDLDLRAGDAGTPLLDKERYLMEVKVPGAMPMWLVHILSDLRIYSTSFSKYGSIYEKNEQNNRRSSLCSAAY